MKTCSLCKQEKEEKEFYNDPINKSGKRSWCIKCRKDYSQRYYKENKDRCKVKRSLYDKLYRQSNFEKIAKRNEAQRQEYISDWVNYFKNKYGESPKCRVCGRDLEWKLNGKRTSKSVCFDHKSNGLLIKRSPYCWYQTHSCNDRNIKVWEQCNFGILCCRCNFFLPTENREKWFEQIKQYIYGGVSNAV